MNAVRFEQRVQKLLLGKQMALCIVCQKPHGASSLACIHCSRKECVKCCAPFRDLNQKYCRKCLRDRAEKE